MRLARNAGLLCLVMMCGCLGVTPEMSRSELHHVFAEPVRSVDSLHYFELKEGFFSNRTAVQALFKGKRMVPVDNPMAARVAWWMDRMDSTLRARFPEALSGIPTPSVRLTNAAGLDALVPGIPRCVQVALRPESAEHVRSLGMLKISRPGQLVPGEPLPWNCEELSGEDLARLARLASHGECRIRFESGSREFVATDGCFPDAEGERRFVRAEALQWTSVGNLVVLNGGAAAALTKEEKLVAVLAHELSHYYRAHGSSLLPSIGHFYRHDAYVAGRPPESPEAMRIALELRKWAAFAKVAEIPGQRVHTALWSVMDSYGSLVEHCPEGDDECVKQCDAYGSWWERNGSPYFDLLGNFPTTLDGTDAEFVRRWYPDLEKAFVACAGVLPADEEIAERVAGLMPEPPEGEWWNVDGEGSVLDLLDGAAQEYEAFDRKADAVVARGRALGFGWYTEEQEADEMSLEILALLGIDAGYARSVYLSMAESADRRDEPGAQECAVLAARGWRDEQGRSVTLLPGRLDDPHHDPCFRAFNIDHELLRHRELSPGVQQAHEMLPRAAWARLQAGFMEFLRSL